MKAKKPLVFVVFILLPGRAGAGYHRTGRGCPGNGRQGDLAEVTDYFFNWGGMVVDLPVSGDFVMAGNWVEYQMLGDLEGV